MRRPVNVESTIMRVLAYLGPGRYLYTAAVSRAWAVSYGRITEPLGMAGLTSATAAAESVAMLRHAVKLGAPFTLTVLMAEAARHGATDVLSLLLRDPGVGPDSGPDADPSVIYAAAARKGRVPILQWAHAGGVSRAPLPSPPPEPSSSGGVLSSGGSANRSGGSAWGDGPDSAGSPHTAVESDSDSEVVLGELAVLKCKWRARDVGPMRLAALGGHIDALQWLQDHDFPWEPQAARWAVRGGSLAALQWLHDARNGRPLPLDTELLCMAAEGGDVPMCAWLHERGVYLTEDVCRSAALQGRIPVLQWVRDSLQGRELPWSTWTCEAAASGGHLDTLQWLHRAGCPWDAWSPKAAAFLGHLEMIKWLHQQGCPWDERTSYAAASEGHLALLEWIHTHGCPWNSQAVKAALTEGHLDVLKYLHAQGCPWDNQACCIAAAEGHLDVLRWLHDIGCAWSAETCMHAALQGHLYALQWLRRQGCPWDSNTASAAWEMGKFACYIWAVEHGCPQETPDGVPEPPKATALKVATARERLRLTAPPSPTGIYLAPFSSPMKANN